MSDVTPFERYLASPSFLPQLEKPGVLAAFGPWVKEWGQVQGTFFEALCARAWRERAAQEVKFLGVLGKLNEALKGAGLPAWLLKGPSLAYRLYDSPLHRPYSDLDILVAEHRWKDLGPVMEGLGASADAPGVWAGTVFRRTYQIDGVTVEGHRQMLTGRDLEGISRWHSRECSVPGMDWFREFETNLLFVYLCGHGAFQHLFDQLHWLVDLDRLARREVLDPSAVERLALRLQLRRAVAVSSAVLRRHFGTPLPNRMGEGGPWTAALSWFLARYLTPERILGHEHRRPRALYLTLKAMLRDRFSEALAYGLSRTLAEGPEL